MPAVRVQLLVTGSYSSATADGAWKILDSPQSTAPTPKQTSPPATKARPSASNAADGELPLAASPFVLLQALLIGSYRSAAPGPGGGTSVGVVTEKPPATSTFPLSST